MELIQIIESSVTLFSVGLIVFLILSYLLFRVKNRPVNLPGQKKLYTGEVSIIYEKPEAVTDEKEIDKISKRFVIVNNIFNDPEPANEIRKLREINSRFYVYNPGRNRIVKGLELSRIKD